MNGLVDNWAQHERLLAAAQELCHHPAPLALLPEEGLVICTECGREFETYVGRRVS